MMSGTTISLGRRDRSTFSRISATCRESFLRRLRRAPISGPLHDVTQFVDLRAELADQLIELRLLAYPHE